MALNPPYAVRQLNTLDEFASVVRLQREIWGFADVEVLPRRMFVVASKIGGQILGAFDGERMIAFCVCIPGLKPGGRPYLHSHMLGVLPEYRNSGLGRLLKLRQREFALAAHIDLIEWTFDPLETKNAFFNVERLGAVVRRYIFNQYGTTTSHLHSGLPTDRLVAEWWIRSGRVQAILSGEPREAELSMARIEVPSDVDSIRRGDLRQARELQAEIGRQFDDHFRAGLVVTGVDTIPSAVVYLLSPWQLA